MIASEVVGAKALGDVGGIGRKKMMTMIAIIIARGSHGAFLVTPRQGS